ncbi:hypothetical protein SCP_0602190 [Sparassis crispa]|uniref:Uncharacterized protein n=1 Tax=Sparassis crispa TaxID=139825 RepID=A0A401GPT2_9APHY|nr:hypothetical protein SCP_0602190 [Sparassis crispa]GBE84241.1 hypothetical protein SCP_0602190 [Sparassis crispa]
MHLRRLEMMPTSYLTGATTFYPLEVIRRATRLESLSINYVDEFLESYPVLACALRVPPALQYLALSSAGPKTHQLLSKMASRPREIRFRNLAIPHGLSLDQLLQPFTED